MSEHASLLPAPPSQARVPLSTHAPLSSSNVARQPEAPAASATHNFARVSVASLPRVPEANSASEEAANVSATSAIYSLRSCERPAPVNSADASTRTEIAGRLPAILPRLREPAGGRSLESEDREFFSQRLGADLTNVRVHADGSAARDAAALKARAFAFGRDIYFGANQYRPAATEGRWLLAHELAHTVQFPEPGLISRAGEGSAVPKPKETGTVSRIVLIVHKKRIDVHTTRGVFSYQLNGSNIPVGNYKAKVEVSEETRTNKRKRSESYTLAQFNFAPIMLPGTEDKAPVPVEHFRFGWGPPKEKGQIDFTDLIRNTHGLSVDVTVNLENDIILEQSNFIAFNDKGENFTGNADPEKAEGGGPGATPPKKEGEGDEEGEEGEKEAKGGFGTGIDGGGPQANLPPFPSSLSGVEDQILGAIGAYTMRLDYSIVGPVLLDQVGAAANWVNYKWERYDVTTELEQRMQPEGVDASRVADPEARRQRVGKELNEQIKRNKVLKEDKSDAESLGSASAAGRRYDQGMEEQEENKRTSDERLSEAIKNGDIGGAIINAFNTNEVVVGVSTVVTAAGSGLNALADLFGGPSSEQEIAWTKPGVFVLRVIASPKPIIEPEGRPPSVHAPSVATLMVQVRDPKQAAEAETSRLDVQETNLEQARSALATLQASGVDDEDPNIKALRRQVEQMELATTAPAAQVIDKIIAEKEKKLSELRARYSGLKGYKPSDLRDLEHELEELYEQREHARKRVGSGAVRALGTLISEVDGNRYTLLLQADVLPTPGGKFIAKLSDVTSPDGIYIDATAATPEGAMNAAVEKFAGQNDYGRGRLSIVVPAGGEGTEAAHARIARSVKNRPVDDKIAAGHLQNLAKAAAAIALVVPGTQEVAAVIGAAAAAENLARRARQDTLRLDSQAVADVANILGAAALGATKIGSAVVTRGSKNFTLAVKAKDAAAAEAAASTVNTGTKIATASAYAAKGIGYFQIGQFSADTLIELERIQKQELSGQITHAEARRRKFAIASQVLQQTAAHAAGAAEETRQKASERARGVGSPKEEGAGSPADRRLRAAAQNERITSGSASRKTAGKSGRGAEIGTKVPPEPTAPTPEKAAAVREADQISSAVEIDLPEGSVFHAADPTSRVDAEEGYHNSVADRTRESALFHNPETGMFIVVQGGETSVGVEGPAGESEIPQAGRAQRWKELLEGHSDTGRWELVAHSHPNAAGTEQVGDWARFPSGGDGDFGLLVWAAENSGGQAQESRIDFKTAEGPDHTIFKFDPHAGLPYTVDYPDPQTGTRVEVSFETMQEYHEYLARVYKSKAGPVPDWVLDTESALLHPVAPAKSSTARGENTPAKAGAKTPKSDEPEFSRNSLDQLSKRAAKDPEALWDLWNRYREMAQSPARRKELRARAEAGDHFAQGVLNQTPPPNRFAEKTAKRHAPPGSTEMQSQLKSELQAFRRAAPAGRRGKIPGVHEGDTEGGTLGVARSDIPGLSEEIFGGASPRAGGAVDLTYKAPSTHGSTHGHAEQSMFGRFARRLRALLNSKPPQITRSQLEGKAVWALIEQEVCSTCRQGLANPDTEAGVIQQFSTEFPELRIELRALDTSEVVIVKGGKRIN